MTPVDSDQLLHHNEPGGVDVFFRNLDLLSSCLALVSPSSLSTLTLSQGLWFPIIRLVYSRVDVVSIEN